MVLNRILVGPSLKLLIGRLSDNNLRSRRRFSLLATTAAAAVYCFHLPIPTVSAAAASSFFSNTADMSFSTERRDGTITVSPKNEADQSALVVINHGLGDSAEGFADVAEYFAKEMPYVKFILPTAPTRRVTMNMGMAMPSWYDITGLDERSNENCEGLEESVNVIQDILKTEHENTKLPYSRMLLAGFSQGGALSLFTGMQLSEPLAGIAILSGYLPAASKFQITSGLEATPILHCHGTQDPVVNYDLAQKTCDKLKGKGAQNYTIKSYPIGHTVAMDELAEVLKFLKSVLPDDANCKISVKEPKEMSVKELKAAIRKSGLASQAVGLMEKHEFVRLLENFRSGSGKL